MERQGSRKCDGDGSGSLPLAEPGEADIRAQLDRILGSPEFNVPTRVRQFLSYVVEQTLSGQAERIKAYTVAVEVFGRDANFDIQNDPVVRIEAGRLRRALERYYLLAGSQDPILIEIPKGGYVPHFGWRIEHDPPSPLRAPPAVSQQARPEPILSLWLKRPWLAGSTTALLIAAVAAFIWLPNLSSPAATSNDPAQPQGPSLVVRPFVNLTKTPEGDVYAAGLSEEVLAQLARFKEITVFGRETSNALAPNASAPEIRRQFGSRYILEGSVRTFDGKLRITSRVLDAETSAIIWSEAYDADVRTSSIVDIETSIASKVATAVAQPYGILFRAPPAPSLTRALPSFEAYQCSVRFYRYRTVLDRAEHAPTRDCLERIIARYPDHSTTWAMLAYLYLDEDRFDLNRRPGSPAPLERARDAAQRAVRLDPQNVRALQALMTVLFFSKEPVEALRIGSQALALNPNDAELLAEFGSRVAQAGDWKRGAALLEEALNRNPGHSDYYVGLLALAAYMQGEDQEAVELIRRANLKRFSIYQFVAALIFARSGLGAEAAQSRAEFLRLRPDFFDDFAGELNKRNFNARDRAILVQGAIQAGFPVKPHLADRGN